VIALLMLLRLRAKQDPILTWLESHVVPAGATGLQLVAALDFWALGHYKLASTCPPTTTPHPAHTHTHRSYTYEYSHPKLQPNGWTSYIKVGPAAAGQAAAGQAAAGQALPSAVGSWMRCASTPHRLGLLQGHPCYNASKDLVIPAFKPPHMWQRSPYIDHTPRK
jgi:hypothetical protein